MSTATSTPIPIPRNTDSSTTTTTTTTTSEDYGDPPHQDRYGSSSSAGSSSLSRSPLPRASSLDQQGKATPAITKNSPTMSNSTIAIHKVRARHAQRINDSMVYLDGPQVYSCSHCRTHLTSHDDIISKSFHGRHGRAYLFDQCVNVACGPAEDRLLITGLHSVCDIFCKRCKRMVGWTYARAYETSQKYKEGKFIIEKINLHMEESDTYHVSHPAGEKSDRWRLRSMSWGSERKLGGSPYVRDENVVYEYRPTHDSSTKSLLTSPGQYSYCWDSPAGKPATKTARRGEGGFDGSKSCPTVIRSRYSQMDRGTSPPSPPQL
eukprot:CAMPEP_0202451224 /NCGR_PEP_ID=MMETSP1360-20130828/9694_1 /ASSEMBLY_ACC=CAM_ASM_000848 /TAXON_ID=515479 /ORGANISM="Licmophora paradoxa, Strain CCMP2313" /LENGTH=320 /DNA_ID=CAMNT_0049069735 /DNA_START=1019 /DNA_END=1981 /DNA_ORIENTATION=+